MEALLFFRLVVIVGIGLTAFIAAIPLCIYDGSGDQPGIAKTVQYLFFAFPGRDFLGYIVLIIAHVIFHNGRGDCPGQGGAQCAYKFISVHALPLPFSGNSVVCSVPIS